MSGTGAARINSKETETVLVLVFKQIRLQVQGTVTLQKLSIVRES